MKNNKEEQTKMHFMLEYEQREIDRIRLCQYDNLRKCFQNNLVETVLGEDYYNMGVCIYSCDRLTTEDLAYKFKSLKKDNKLFKSVAIISLILNIIFFTQLLITS